MKLKRILAVGVVAALAVSLAACGSSSSGSSDSEAAADEQQEADETELDEAEEDAEADAGEEAVEEEDTEVASTSSGSGSGDTIQWWDISTEGVAYDQTTYAIDQYEANDAADYGYDIEWTAVQNDNYKEKLVIAMSSGECPDVYSSWAGGPLQEYVDSGFGVPVTDYVTEYGLDDLLLDAAIAQGKIGDDVYGVPWKSISIAGVFYVTTIFDEYGLEEPQTVSELEDVCDTLLENGITPFALGNSTKWQGSMFYQTLATRYGGLEPFRAAYDGSGSFEDDCFIYAGDKILDWAQKGYFQEGCNGISTDDGQDRQAMYQGSAAMLNSGSWYCATFLGDNEEWYLENIGWFPFPECDEVENAEEYYWLANGTVGDQFCTFTCEGDKLDAAFQCFSYLLSDEDIQIGVEGGNIPPIKGAEDMIDDPCSKEIVEYVNNCTDVQLWYDQFLPTSVANAHLDNSQLLFTNEITSEEVAQAEQDAMQDYLQNGE